MKTPIQEVIIKIQKRFVKEYHEYNGDPEEYDPNFLVLPDFAIMSFLAKKLITNHSTGS